MVWEMMRVVFQSEAAFTASAVGQGTALLDRHSPGAALKGQGVLQGSAWAGFGGAGVTSQKYLRREK